VAAPFVTPNAEHIYRALLVLGAWGG